MSEAKPVTRQDFIKLFNRLAQHKHRYELFRDFVTMSAIALHNAIHKDETLEQEYLQIVGQYREEEVDGMTQLLALLIELMEPEPRDVLGELYMELELGNDQTGQYFTPPEISELMATLNVSQQLINLEQPFITLSEPACGAGGMVLAFVKAMMLHQHNPSEKLWVQCIDIDRLAGLMCYLQLSLWHIPAQVIIGNTLTLNFRQQWFTPAHYMGNWEVRLQCRRLEEQLAQEAVNTAEIDELEALPVDEPADVVETEQDQVTKGDNFQFDFNF